MGKPSFSAALTASSASFAISVETTGMSYAVKTAFASGSVSRSLPCSRTCATIRLACSVSGVTSKGEEIGVSMSSS